MPYEAYLKAKAPPWLQDTYGQAWLGGIGATLDDYVQQYIAGVLAAFPEYAPADALGVLGDEFGLDQGPNESNASFAARLRAAWIYWKLAGTPLGILTALYFAGFDGAVLVQQNGLAYSLSGAPTPGVDPTPLLTVQSCEPLAVGLTSNVTPPTTTSAGRSIPGGTQWWTIDSNTDFCSRFVILFPTPAPPFYCVGRAYFNGVDTASLTWPSPFGDTTYLMIPGKAVISGPSAPQGLAVAAEGTPGTTSWTYHVTAVDANGAESSASPAVVEAQGAATLNGTNYNALTWLPVAGCTYNVYRDSAGGTPNTTGCIATGLNVTSFNDQGGALVPFSSPPSPTIWIDSTTKTTSGVTVSASAPFTGYVDVLACQSGANPFADLHPADLQRLQNTIKKWRPAKATCRGILVAATGKFMGWPIQTQATNTMSLCSIVQFQGA